jgi:hypothetical protein
MAEEPGFFSQAAGQARRRRLNELFNEGADYFLGPTGIPDRLRAAGEMFNPIAMGEEASVQATVAADPERTTEERLAALAAAGVNIAGIGLPAVLGLMRAIPNDQALIQMLLGGAPQQRPLRVSDDGRPSRHRIFEGGASPFRNPGTEDVLLSEPGRVYRTTGQRQVEDIIESGLVRAKPEGERMRGGKTGEVHWADADPNTWYRQNADNMVLVAPRGSVADRQGGIPLDELEAIYQWRDGMPVDILSDIIARNRGR